MSAEEQQIKTAAVTAAADATTEAIVDQERSEKILKAKELYSQGSRNFLVKSYAESADELSQVCALYEELYGELSDELGMPYLLYAKSLIALALDENKVIDVPDEEDDDDDDDDNDDGDEEVDADVTNDEKKTVVVAKNGEATPKSTNGSAEKMEVESLDAKKKVTADEADSTDNNVETKLTEEKESKAKNDKEKTDEALVTSTETVSTDDPDKNGTSSNGNSTVVPSVDGEKPSTSTSNGGDAAAVATEDDEEENEAASSLQLAWEILELAAKIFSRQGLSGLSNLAEVQTELANIEFENNILDASRDDYEKALKIYSELTSNYRRAMAEIHYKIGLTYLMQSLNKEGAESLKQACNLIEEEISEIKAKKDISEKDKNNIQDMEETKQEILAKIVEIEEMQAQQIADVRAALDKVIKPVSIENADGAGPSSSSTSSTNAAGAPASSSSSAAITSSSKPKDISHLIKRKKPEDAHSEAEAVTSSPAKRPAV